MALKRSGTAEMKGNFIWMVTNTSKLFFTQFPIPHSLSPIPQTPLPIPHLPPSYYPLLFPIPHSPVPTPYSSFSIPILIPHFPFPIPHSPFPIPHSPFPIPHSPFPIPHSPTPILYFSNIPLKILDERTIKKSVKETIITFFKELSESYIICKNQFEMGRKWSNLLLIVKTHFWTSINLIMKADIQLKAVVIPQRMLVRVSQWVTL